MIRYEQGNPRVGKERRNSRVRKTVAAGVLTTLALAGCSGSSRANKPAESDKSSTNVPSSSVTSNAAFKADHSRYGSYINEVSNIRYSERIQSFNDALDFVIADGCYDMAEGPLVTDVTGGVDQSATTEQQHAFRAFLADNYRHLRGQWHATFTSRDMHDATRPTFQAEMNGCPPNNGVYSADYAYAASQVTPSHPEG